MMIQTLRRPIDYMRLFSGRGEMFRASDQSDNTLLIVWAATKARRPLSWLTTRVMIALLLLLLLLFLLLMDGSSCLASSALMLFRACAAALPTWLRVRR